MYDAPESDLKTYTKENEQTARAASFLRSFLRGQRLKAYKKHLKQAYINNDQQSRADRL
jgi:hypothetical protein